MSVVRTLLPLLAAQILLLPADFVAQNLRIRTITKIAVGHQPNGMALTGTELYVTNLRDGTVSIIDIRSNSVRHTLQTCKEPRVVATTHDRARAFVGCRDGVAVITAATKDVR